MGLGWGEGRDGRDDLMGQDEMVAEGLNGITGAGRRLLIRM